MKQKEKFIGTVIILILFVVFLFIGFNISKNNKQKSEDIFIENDNKSISENTNSEIRVEIKGAVKSPDVYSLKKGSIILDLVKLAGGYNDDADKDSIIQSAKLNDGDCVRVKRKGDTSVNNSSANSLMNDNNGKVNINNATKEQLMKLDGIGESRAEKIIKYREENGPYKSVEDLKKIGARIGDSIINNIKDKVEVN